MNYDIGFSAESGSYGQGSANAKSRTQPFPSEVYSKSYKIYGRKHSERGWSLPLRAPRFTHRGARAAPTTRGSSNAGCLRYSAAWLRQRNAPAFDARIWRSSDGTSEVDPTAPVSRDLPGLGTEPRRLRHRGARQGADSPSQTGVRSAGLSTWSWSQGASVNTSEPSQS